MRTRPVMSLLLALTALATGPPRPALGMGLPTQGGGWPSGQYTVETQCTALTLQWADISPGRQEFRFATTCTVAEKGGAWKEGVVSVAIEALWKASEHRAWEKVTITGDWIGQIDTIWACPGNPFVTAVPCTSREHISTTLHPAVANRPQPFAANATTPAKAAAADAAGDAAKKAQLEAAASLGKGMIPFARIESPESGQVYANELSIRVRPQNVSPSLWFEQCCEVELARSLGTGPDPSGPWGPAITYGDRNDVLTPMGWIVAKGSLEPGWWRVRARGCCITGPGGGVGTYWPWSPWREFRVVLGLMPGGGSSIPIPGPVRTGCAGVRGKAEFGGNAARQEIPLPGVGRAGRGPRRAS